MRLLVLFNRVKGPTTIGGGPAVRLETFDIGAGTIGEFSSTVDIVNETSHSTHHVEQEVKLTKREDLVKILEDSHGVVIRVIFHKKVTQKHVEEKLADPSISIATAAERKKLAISLLTGEKREMDCIVVSTSKEQGRTTVIDLEAFRKLCEEGVVAPHLRRSRSERLIDHRTLTDVIRQNIHFTCPFKP